MAVTERHALHPLAWIAWLVAVCSMLSATRNPLHLGIALLCVALTASACGLRTGVMRLAASLILVTALLNLLVGRVGATVLWHVPDSWPLIGGPLTLESLVYGGLNGLALAGVVVAFSTAQAAIPTRTLLDLLPPALAPIAVTLTIAVTFIPALLRQLQHIREAQLIRGHQIRHLRDWLALLMPLLIGGLERSLQLAETLAARGFPHQAKAQRQTTSIISAGTALLAGGLLTDAWGQHAIGLGAIITGLMLIGGAIWYASSTMPQTRYRQYRWASRDLLVIGAAALTAAIVLLPVGWIDRAVLIFTPYPRLSMPHFSIAIGIATLGLAGPGLLALSAPQPEPAP